MARISETGPALGSKCKVDGYLVYRDVATGEDVGGQASMTIEGGFVVVHGPATFVKYKAGSRGVVLGETVYHVDDRNSLVIPSSLVRAVY